MERVEGGGATALEVFPTIQKLVSSGFWMMIISAYAIRRITAGSWATNWTKKGEVGLPGVKKKWGPSCFAGMFGPWRLEGSTNLQNRGST